MADLSVIILTKDEEKNIEKCIQSFRGIAKKFIVVDSFSTDRTKEICENLEYDIDFYAHEFSNQADQINWAIENIEITTEWVMRIDADEEVLPELADEIEKRLCKLENHINGVILKRRLIFMGRWLKHGGRYPEYLLRIWRNGLGICEQKIMDEHMILKHGELITFKHDIQDNNQKSLAWWTDKHNKYSDRELLDHKRELEGNNKVTIENNGVVSKQAKAKRRIKNNGYYRLPKFFRAHLYFIYRYYIRLGFLDGPEGKIYTFLQAYWYRFLVDAKMFEHEKQEGK